MHLVLFFAAAALVSVECNIIGAKSTALSKNTLDNTIQPQGPRAKSHGRIGRNVVRISGHPPKSLQHEPGTVLELTCKVTGRPAPSVQWYKNGEPVDDGNEEESNEMFPIQPGSIGILESTLLFTTPSPNPEDVYTCVATAGIKKAEYSTTVFTPQDANEPIEFNLFEMPRGPRIVTHYSAIFIDIGSDTILPCRVNAHPKAVVYWTDSNDNLVYDNPRFKVLSSGDLYISSVNWGDMGDFKCTVKNAFGSETIETFVYPTAPA